MQKSELNVALPVDKSCIIAFWGAIVLDKMSRDRNQAQIWLISTLSCKYSELAPVEEHIGDQQIMSQTKSLKFGGKFY